MDKNRHVLVKVSGFPKHCRKLYDDEHFFKACKGACKNGKATIVARSSHDFGENYGYTAICVLAESHISIHTWPEDGYALIDVLTCGNIDIGLISLYISNYFDAMSTTTKCIER